MSYIVLPSYCCVVSSYCCTFSYCVAHFVCVPYIVKLRPRIVEFFISLHYHLASLHLYDSTHCLRFCGVLRTFAVFGASYFCIASHHCTPSTIDIIHIRQLIESRRMNQGPLVEPTHFKHTCSGWFVFYFGVELRSEYHQESSSGTEERSGGTS